MARTEITVQQLKFQESNSITGSAADSTNGMFYVNNGLTALFVYNAGTGEVEVTITSVPDEAGRTGDYVKSIDADGVEMFGPFRQEWWNQADGTVFVDFDSDTDVTVSAVQFL